MKGTSLIVLAASLVSASPIAPRNTNVTPPSVSDIYIAQFTLFLENLETAFYNTSLEQCDAAAFEAAGYPPWVRGRIAQIGEHEKTHANVWSQIVVDAGAVPVKPCEYSFPITDAKSVVAVATALEHGGGAAYQGALGKIQDKNILRLATSITGTENRQSSWLSSAVNKQQPWDGTFQNTLDTRQIFSIASGFVKSCPTDNFDFGLTPYPALTLDPPAPPLTSTVSVSFNGGTEPLYLAFITQVTAVFVPIVNGAAQIPADLKGVIYVVVTTSNSSASDAVTVAGPAILEYPYDSYASDA